MIMKDKRCFILFASQLLTNSYLKKQRDQAQSNRARLQVTKVYHELHSSRLPLLLLHQLALLVWHTICCKTT